MNQTTKRSGRSGRSGRWRLAVTHWPPAATLSRNLKILSGPSTFIFYPNVNGRRILLLGEYHDDQGRCDFNTPHADPVFEVHEWLGQLAVAGPECLDILLESNYLTASPEQSGGRPLSDFPDGIMAIEDKFQTCLTIQHQEKQQCFSDRVRFHYIDLRYLKSNGSQEVYPVARLHSMARYFGLDFRSVTDQLAQGKYRSHQRTLFMVAMGFNVNQAKTTIFMEYLDDLATQLGLEPLTDIQDYLAEYRQVVRKEMDKLAPNPNQQRFLLTLLDVLLAQAEHDSVLILTAPMDVYCLLRLFVQFDHEKLARGPVMCRQSKYDVIKNAVVYAGEAHIEVYDQFLQAYFQVKPTIAIEQPNDQKCLYFDQPFDFFA